MLERTIAKRRERAAAARRGSCRRRSMPRATGWRSPRTFTGRCRRDRTPGAGAARRQLATRQPRRRGGHHAPASGDDPPLLLYHGRYDWTVAPDHARALGDALLGAGVPVAYHESPHGHFGTFVFDDAPVAAAIGFLDVWLGNAREAGLPLPRKGERFSRPGQAAPRRARAARSPCAGALASTVS